MFYYSKNSRRKVFHNPGCRYMRSFTPFVWSEFRDYEEARNAGFRECHCCSRIGKYYRREHRKLEEMCASQGLSCHLGSSRLTVKTPYSHWNIIISDRTGSLILLHRNIDPSKPQDPASPIEGYHLQKVKKHSIEEYFNYILEHDEYRRRHPYKMLKTAKAPEKPKPYTKKWKEAQKRKKKKQRRDSIRHVLYLIDHLSSPAAGA